MVMSVVRSVPVAGNVRRAEVETPPRHDALELTGGGNIAQIKLDSQLYTLRITRAGKLILTK